MSDFDSRAADWDANPMHRERAEAIVKALLATGVVKKTHRLLDFGAGSGLLGELLGTLCREMVLMDSSAGMVEVMRDKVVRNGWINLEPIHHDLLVEAYLGCPFDGIVTQMVLHHIDDIPALLLRFSEMLRPGGFLAIADLYPEDGSFHGEGFTGHLGFEPAVLTAWLDEAGFEPISLEPCFTVRKPRGEQLLSFPLFLALAKRK
jgi:2-polyprenyl-3-methyl-5-hydroxy-6-metoxy-1,4-benzoquinol methylase